MPEANVLFAVTAVVVACLVVWVAAVLKTAKEPWARRPAKPATAALEKAAEPAPPPSEDAAATATDAEPNHDAKV